MGLTRQAQTSHHINGAHVLLFGHFLTERRGNHARLHFHLRIRFRRSSRQSR
jgi:hypothetical protein